MKKELKKAIFQIQKKYGTNAIGLVSDLQAEKIKRLSSGSPFLDWAIGGGWPQGRTIELYGPYSSGKSLVALRTIIEAQKIGLSCIYIDAENAFDMNFAQKLGVDTNSLIITQENGQEKVFNMIDILLDSGTGVIVVDSVAALVPEYELEEAIEQQTMALQARVMSKALRKLTGKIGKSNSLLFFINQIREKVGSYGNPEITPGGRALGFYSSIRVEVRRGEWLLEDKKKIGQIVKFKVIKSKICKPWREGYFKYYHTGQFDNADELVSLLLLNEKVTKRGGFYDVLGESFHGRESLEKKISTNKGFREKLKMLIKD